MSKKKYKKGIESINRQIKIHEEKLQRAIDEDLPELTGYYRSEIDRLEGQRDEKKRKLLPRSKRVKEK